MDNKTILAAVDHTLLTQTATWEEIRQVCDDGAAYGCASVCIPASYVKRAADYLGDRLPVCTVIGFPNGYCTTAVKVFEARDAIANGASEIDMVINIGWAKDGRWDDLLAEIRAVRRRAAAWCSRSSSRHVCSPRRRRCACAGLYRRAERITSRRPPASPPLGLPGRMWRCLKPMWPPM